MTPLRRTVAALGFLAAAASLVLVGAPTAHADSSSATCAQVVTIAARGTTTTNNPTIGMLGQLADAIQDQTGKSDRIYDLPYKSTTVGFVASYHDDVADGEKLLRSYLNDISARCGSKTSFVLIGWSKGANVVMDTIDDAGTQLSSTVRGRIKAVVVYGDPTFNVDMPFDRGTFNKGALSVFPRFTDFTTFGYSRIRSYCDDGDLVCQSNLLFGKSVHESYFKKYDSTAASFVVDKLGG